MTRELSAPADRIVWGVDPAPAMLAFARRQPGADRVSWLEGDVGALGKLKADLVIMAGNVAQVFLEEAQWLATLREVRAALRSGGVLAFEARNPEARAWEEWTRAETYERFDSPYGPMESWLEVVSVQAGRVRFIDHNLFLGSGENLAVESELRFRSQTELIDSLVGSGFEVEGMFGDWQRGALLQQSPVMVFVSRRI